MTCPPNTPRAPVGHQSVLERYRSGLIVSSESVGTIALGGRFPDIARAWDRSTVKSAGGHEPDVRWCVRVSERLRRAAALTNLGITEKATKTITGVEAGIAGMSMRVR